MFFIISQIIIAYIYGHILEWLIHRFVLHKLGKRRASVFSFHFYGHHKRCRKNKNYDEGYTLEKFYNAKEVWGLIFLSLLHIPLLLIAPWFVFILFLSCAEYYLVHKRCHTDIMWGKENLRHHYDHHMGKNQNKNWGVRSCMIDRIMGTRQE